MLIVSALVVEPLMEYFIDCTPHECNKGSPSKRNRRFRVFSPLGNGGVILFFKLVLFDFAVQSALGNTQIACRIFSFVIIFSQCTDDELFLLLLD